MQIQDACLNDPGEECTCQARLPYGFATCIHLRVREPNLGATPATEAPWEPLGAPALSSPEDYPGGPLLIADDAEGLFPGEGAWVP